MEKKFFATYKSVIDDCSFDEIAEFETEQERDDWVNHQDALEREPLADLEFLGISLDEYTRVPDEALPNVFWYVLSPAR